MSMWSDLRYRIRRLDRRRAERDFDDELRIHLELEIEENLAAGMSPDEARRAARRKLGSAAVAKEDARAVWQVPFVETAWRDLRGAVRVLRVRPAYTLAAVLSLALGIGVCTAIFSAVDGILLRPLPFPAADRIVEVREQTETGRSIRFAEPNYRDLRARSRAFAALAQYTSTTETVTGGSRPVRIDVVVAARDFFRIFQIEPVRGRAFSREESAPGGAPAAVVSHAFWQHVLGGREQLGRVHIVDETYTIVGVMPPGFAFPGRADVWISRERLLANKYWTVGTDARTAHNWSVVGRLAEGTTLAQARADVSGVARQLKREFGETTHAADMALIRLQDHIVGDVERALWTVLGAVGLLLFIAIANVANLMLAQAAARGKELALRAALGASRARLTAQFVTEALVLALCGAALGIPLAVASVELLLGLDRAALPRADEIGVDARALAFTVGLSLVVAVTLGVVTALRGSRVALYASAVETGGQHTAGLSRSRLRRGLVVTQIALAFTLLIGAGLLARSFARLVAVDPGFRGDGAVAMELSVTAFGDGQEARVRRLYDELLDRFGTLPGVTAVGAANALPLTGQGASGTFLIDGALKDFQAPVDPARAGYAEYRVASAGYFAAMQIPLLDGRPFGRSDSRSAPHVAVVSQSLARAMWPGGDVIGKRIQFGNMDGDGRLLHVVGIVGDVRENGLDAPVRPTVYAHAVQRPPPSTLSLVVRAAADPVALIPAMRAVLEGLDPELPADFRTLDQIVESSLDRRRFGLVLLAVFAAVALLLALTGIYSVTAYSVAQRTREIGVRMALGARPRLVLGAVIGEGARMALFGVAIGAAAALATTRLIASWLYGVGAADPSTFAWVALALTGAAVAACWVPARRAVRVHPAIALRAE